jgi:hypothetical protein
VLRDRYGQVNLSHAERLGEQRHQGRCEPSLKGGRDIRRPWPDQPTADLDRGLPPAKGNTTTPLAGPSGPASFHING